MPIPINLDTINQLYGTSFTSLELEAFFASVAEPRSPLQTSEDIIVSRVGRELYEKFFRNYTRKQWGLDPSELDASVTARIPVRTNRDDRYFTDTYQAMPLQGYTRMFERMLDNPNIRVLLNSDYREIKTVVPHKELIYTGPVDEYFDYCYGKLPYRSLRFEWETRDTAVAQSAPVINYPNDHLYTRVTEFKYLSGQEHPKTTLVYEYPTDEGDPYYPVPTTANAALYAKYQALANESREVQFLGRLGTYKVLQHGSSGGAGPRVLFEACRRSPSRDRCLTWRSKYRAGSNARSIELGSVGHPSGFSSAVRARQGVSCCLITAGYQQAQPLLASVNGWQETVAVSAF